MHWEGLFFDLGRHAVVLGVWVSLALSLNLINGCAGLFSLGHQGFWAVGAYTAALVVPLVASDGGQAPGLLAFLCSFPAAMLAAALFGLVVGLPCLRLRGDYLAIATLGFSEIFRNVANNLECLGKARGLEVHNVVRELLLVWQGWPAARRDLPLEGADLEALRSAELTARTGEMAFYLVLSWGVALLTLLLLRNLMLSGHGRAIKAIRDDETAAELLGVNLTRYKVLAFVLGAALAGLAGAVYANFERYVTPGQFGFMQGVILVAMVVLGGMGSATGTVLATCILYILPVVLTYLPSEYTIPIFYDPTRGGLISRSPFDLWQIFFALLLILVVLLRPQGLMGRREWPFLLRPGRTVPPRPSLPASPEGRA
jgi:branched-chain amino acid transport system permease protein